MQPLKKALKKFVSGTEPSMRVIPILFAWVSDRLYQLSLISFVLALQPQIKLAYCKKMWDEVYYDTDYNALKETVCNIPVI
jgi:hypothetical protein